MRDGETPQPPISWEQVEDLFESYRERGRPPPDALLDLVLGFLEAQLAARREARRVGGSQDTTKQERERP